MGPCKSSGGLSFPLKFFVTPNNSSLMPHNAGKVFIFPFLLFMTCKCIMDQCVGRNVKTVVNGSLIASMGMLRCGFLVINQCRYQWLMLQPILTPHQYVDIQFQSWPLCFSGLRDARYSSADSLDIHFSESWSFGERQATYCTILSVHRWKTIPRQSVSPTPGYAMHRAAFPFRTSLPDTSPVPQSETVPRSEERRVGKECSS